VRVAIAHEWLVRYAGSEKCVEEMLAVFPDARLLTSVVRPGALPPAFARAEPSLLQHIPGATKKHELLLPLMPAAWRSRVIRDVDVVISSSHACANAVRMEAGTPHLSYCHTPMRYAWGFEAESTRVPTLARLPARVAMAYFRRWDRNTAARVTRFVANSSAVAVRIQRFYGREASVVHPPVDTEFFTPGGERGEDFLYVGRLTGYKRFDLAVDAFRGLQSRLLVVGEGADSAVRWQAPPNVKFLGSVDGEELRALYRSARAVIAPGVEDFGIAMAEAQSCGTPVIAAREGGASDIVLDGATGWLVERQSPEAFREAVRRATSEELDEESIHTRAQRFARRRFHDEIRSEVDELVGQGTGSQVLDRGAAE
jgi:glycosyltransferase involved in cell wall biosynthesis